MAWTNLPDSESVTSADTLKIRILGGYIELFVSEGKVRQYLSDYTMLSILSVSRVLFVGYDVLARPTGSLTVAQVRESVSFALTMMRDEWAATAPGMSVAEIAVQRGLLPNLDVPATTAISLVAITILVMAGLWLWRSYK